MRIQAFFSSRSLPVTAAQKPELPSHIWLHRDCRRRHSAVTVKPLGMSGEFWRILPGSGLVSTSERQEFEFKVEIKPRSDLLDHCKLDTHQLFLGFALCRPFFDKDLWMRSQYPSFGPKSGMLVTVFGATQHILWKGKSFESPVMSSCERGKFTIVQQFKSSCLEASVWASK